MNTLEKGADGYYHPSCEDDVRGLILQARDQGKLIRVRGSAHSASGAIYTSCDSKFPCDKNPPPDDGNLNLMLNEMRAILDWDDEKMQVSVQAGCHLGKDPSDPTHTSTWENSLFYWMKEKGWAMPDMGGIIHQAVGGFLATGSSGSSLHYAFNEQLVALRIIDGTGEVIDLDQSDDRFFAAGVSLGLLGIITQVTFQCVKAFNVVGEQSTTTVSDCKVDLFGDGSSGKPDVAQFFQDTEHTRLMWWPQKGVERMVVWQAMMVKASKEFKPKQYREFPKILGTLFFAEFAADIVFRIFSFWTMKGLLGGITRFFLRTVYPLILKLFVPVDGKKGPQKFQDYWWRGMPMDNTASDKLVPTRFIEVWFPVSRSQEVMQAMKKIYEENGVWATGTYSCEIYPTPASKFWLSPAYGEKVVKVDVFWFEGNKGDPIELYYPQFWNGLAHLEFRPHWGKYLPYSTDEPTKWVEYVRPKYPKWDAFMNLREKMDPDQIFVTEYWRKHLGIAPK